MGRSGLAGFRDGVSERFVPGAGQNPLVEAEHLARYRWAAGLAAGRRVLDAGCGAGYGSALLAEAGAESVTGADVAGELLDAVRSDMPAAVRLDVADVRRLPYDDCTFDLVVCFNVIETLEEPGVALDELGRVLAPEGLLLVSTPNRAAQSPPSPHHRHEFSPDELRDELRSRLGHVTMLHQRAYLTVSVGEDGTAGDEDFALAAAGRVELAAMPPVCVAASALQVPRWLATFAQLHASAAVDYARIMELEEQATGLAAEVERTRDELAAASARAERAERAASALTGSASWRVTAPLRRLKQVARRSTGS